MLDCFCGLNASVVVPAGLPCFSVNGLESILESRTGRDVMSPTRSRGEDQYRVWCREQTRDEVNKALLKSRGQDRDPGSTTCGKRLGCRRGLRSAAAGIS